MINKKKVFLLLVLNLCSCLLLGQTEFKFYKSMEDYQNDDFLEHYDIVPRSWSHADFTPEVIEIKIDNGKAKEIKMADCPADFYSESEGVLYRRFEKKSYMILVHGGFCFYMKRALTKDPEYYSETLSGPVKKFKKSILEKKLKEKGLYQAYRQDKPRREFKDSVNDYWNKEIKRIMKYINLLNYETD